VSPNDDTLIALGLIQKPRGLSGELAVWPYQANSCSFRRGLPVVVKTEKTSLNTTIEYVKQIARRFAVKLEGIDTRETAEEYRGAELLCRFDQLPRKKTGEYFVFELVGLKIVDDTGEVYGKIKDVLNLPANDILVIDSKQGEFMIPFIQQIIDEISIDKGYVKIIKIDDYIVT